MEHVEGRRPADAPLGVAPAPAGWHDPADLAHQIIALHPTAQPAAWYRFGDGWLGLSPPASSLDEQLMARYVESRESGSASSRAPGAPWVHCSVMDAPDLGATVIRFQDPEPLDQAGFLASLFPERATRVGGPGDVSRLSTTIGPLVLGPDWVLVRRTDLWQLLIANLAIHRLLRLQPDLLCLHAASVVIQGQGIVVAGPKGSGKTTLATALAARGHGFLGDEIAAIRVTDLTVQPFRRAVSVRDGPMDPAVARALDRAAVTPEVFADGTRRRRVAMRELFPDSPMNPAPLRWLVFLEPRQSQPRLTEFRPGPSELTRLNPLASSLWGVPPSRQAFRALRLMGQVRTARLEPGDPSETVTVLERLIEE